MFHINLFLFVFVFLLLLQFQLASTLTGVAPPPLPTLATITLKASTNNNVDIQFTSLGPTLLAKAFTLDTPQIYLGYCTGFLRPTIQSGVILHLDSMVVYQSRVAEAKRRTGDGGANSKLNSGLGLGLILGTACLAHALSITQNPLQKLEILAIADSPKQSKRLVRYYRKLGLVPVRDVGDAIKDIPDRLVWGGRGVLMNDGGLGVGGLLDRWREVI
ncbi:hypothetical protein ScalyP_jg6232 [Parmales sp. scaly parma]|nr:hypothetical protein ScalyP_jg6232 [Parmales sp. scaly parma]